MIPLESEITGPLLLESALTTLTYKIWRYPLSRGTPRVSGGCRGSVVKHVDWGNKVHLGVWTYRLLVSAVPFVPFGPRDPEESRDIKRYTRRIWWLFDNRIYQRPAGNLSTQVLSLYCPCLCQLAFSCTLSIQEDQGASRGSVVCRKYQVTNLSRSLH